MLRQSSKLLQRRRPTPTRTRSGPSLKEKVETLLTRTFRHDTMENIKARDHVLQTFDQNYKLIENNLEFLPVLGYHQFENRHLKSILEFKNEEAKFTIEKLAAIKLQNFVESRTSEKSLPEQFTADLSSIDSSFSEDDLLEWKSLNNTYLSGDQLVT